ncbi:hypothetical protein GCM10020000_40050 [Streptomyces olivoverticillatus]
MAGAGTRRDTTWKAIVTTVTANTAPVLLDLAPLEAARFACIEDKVAALMRTRETVIAMQGEALLPLEACIRSAVRPGSTALNVITGPYGETFGGWLRSCGAEVVTVSAPFSGAVGAEQVAEALRARPDIDFVSLVHAEAATGNTNPVAEIGAVVREHGALLMLDAVASVAAEPLLTDEWGVDLCVIGGQKAMAGLGRSVRRVGQRPRLGADRRQRAGAPALVPVPAGLEGALDRRRAHGSAARPRTVGDARPGAGRRPHRGG